MSSNTVASSTMRNKAAIAAREHDEAKQPPCTIGASPEETIIMPLAVNEARAVWNVANYKSLPRIPPFYVLEQTRASVRSVSPTIVANRITTCLKELSLDASYDDKNAAALVVGADQVSLFIRLYQDNGTSDSIVVEVQKKSGCAFRFHKRARLLLRAASGVASVAARDSASGRVRMCQRSPRPALIQRVDAKPSHVEIDAKREIDLALESADGLVKKDRVDANMLGMESLVLLTDEETTSSEKALHAARVILRGEKFEDVKAKIMTLLEPAETEGDELDYSELKHGDAMHLHALTIVANSLSLLARNDDELSVIASTEEWVGDDGILSTLIRELTNAESTPHCSYQAARSLNTLVGASSLTKRKAIELGAPAVMSLTQNVGHCRHALLAQESDLFMAAIGESK